MTNIIRCILTSLVLSVLFYVIGVTYDNWEFWVILIGTTSIVLIPNSDDAN